MKTTHKTCQTEEVNQVVADSHLMGEVQRLVDEKGQYLTGFKRQLVIAESVIEVIYRYSNLEASI